jgi:hypothetical protein
VFELNKFDQIQLPESIASLFLLDGPWFAVLACNQAGKQEGFLFRQEQKPLKPPFSVKQQCILWIGSVKFLEMPTVK